MTGGHPLGEFLRARRAQVSPEQAGVSSLGRRRVAGLRREEVALLAGISADYYLRLEQGRDLNPSAQVVAALAAALHLDRAAGEHLHRLAGLPGPAVPVAVHDVPQSIRGLLAVLELPAFVSDRRMDVLAVNDLARALSPTHRAGGNRLRAMFLDADERRLFADWHIVAEEFTASFRMTADPTDPATQDLVAELSAGSETFRALWSRHAVEERVNRPPVRLRHPQLGAMTLTRENLAVDGPAGQLLVIYHAPAGSGAIEALRDHVASRRA